MYVPFPLLSADLKTYLWIWTSQFISKFNSGPGCKVNSVQEAMCQMLCGSLIKIWILPNHMKKQNKKLQNAKSVGEKLKTKGLMFFV